MIESPNEIAPELGHQVVAWGFGEVYAGPEPQLEVHVNAALNVGLTPPQIIEAFLHCAVYGGFPRAEGDRP